LRKKLLGKADVLVQKAPRDTDITTLHVAGLTPDMTEEDLKDQFYAYGEIKSIKVVPKANCAFVQYTTREGAEKAADKLFNRLVIKGKQLRVAWGRPPSLESPSSGEGTHGTSTSTSATAPSLPPPPPGLMALPPGFVSPPPGFLPPPGTSIPPPGFLPFPSPLLSKGYYPSMDPSQMGAKPETKEINAGK